MSASNELKIGADSSESNVQQWITTANNFDPTQLDFGGSNVDTARGFQSTQVFNLSSYIVPQACEISNNAVEELEMSTISTEHAPSGHQVGNVQSEAKGDPSRKLNQLSVETEPVKYNRLKDPSQASKQSILTKADRRKPPAKRNTQRKSQLPTSDVRSYPPVENICGEQYLHWYQSLLQYYSQFSNQQADFNRQGYQSIGRLQAPRVDHQKQSFGRVPPYFLPSMTYQAQPNAVGNHLGYDAYQYYAAATAAGMLPGYYPFPGFLNGGRQTPKMYPKPHIRAWFAIPGYLLQILPNRPLDGELACVELLNLSRIANEAVAEATQRSENDRKLRGYSNFVDEHCDQVPNLTRDRISSNTSGLESPDALSSIQCPTGDDESCDDADTRACALIALTWDRIDHVSYPGPLDPSETFKSEVSAFLNGKLVEMQDRYPTDWESAHLLISYLKLLVNNNGIVASGDLVNLLLEDHEPQTHDFHATSTLGVNSKTAAINLSHPPNLHQQARGHLADSISSLHSIGLPSGRQSPHFPPGMYGMMAPNAYNVGPEFNQLSHLRAASEVGGYNTSQEILRRAAATVVPSHTSARKAVEDGHLDQFRKLLMYGLYNKALDHACSYHLWGHAFTLAHRMDKSKLEGVISRFLTHAVAPADPILTSYQLKFGEIPNIVSVVANGKGSDNGEWRAHLAMILSIGSADPLYNPSLQRLGDSLLSRRLTYAAHLCYLLKGAQCEQTHGQQSHLVYRLHEKIWLLGVPSPSPRERAASSDVLTAPIEAVQLTEIYEYAMQLANRNYRLAQLLPFRLMYATRLLDAGLLVKGYNYLAAIGNTILLEAASNTLDLNPVTYSVIGNCLRLAEPLLAHPDLDDLEFLASGSSRFRVARVTTSTSNPWSAEMPGGSWIHKLCGLYQQLHNNLRCTGPMMNLKPSGLPPQSYEPTASHPMQQPQRLDHSRYQEQEKQLRVDIQQPPLSNAGHTDQYLNVRNDRSAVLSADHDGHTRFSGQVCPTPPSPVHASPGGIPVRRRIKTEQLESHTNDGYEENQMTPTNLRVANPSTFSVDGDLQRLSISQHTPSDYQQHISTPTQYDHQMQQHPLFAPQHQQYVSQEHQQQQQQLQYVDQKQQHQHVAEGQQLQNHQSVQLNQWPAGPPVAMRQLSMPQGGEANTMTFEQQSNCAPSSGQFSFLVPVKQPDDNQLSHFDYFSQSTHQDGPRSRKTSISSNADTVVHGDVSGDADCCALEKLPTPQQEPQQPHGSNSLEAASGHLSEDDEQCHICDTSSVSTSVCGDDVDQLAGTSDGLVVPGDGLDRRHLSGRPQEQCIIRDQEQQQTVMEGCLMKKVDVSSSSGRQKSVNTRPVTDTSVGHLNSCAKSHRPPGLRNCAPSPPPPPRRTPSPDRRCLATCIKPSVQVFSNRSSPVPSLPLPTLTIGSVRCDRCACWHSLPNFEYGRGRATQQARSRSNSGTSQANRNSASYGRPTFSSIQHQTANQQQPHAGRPSNLHSGNYPNLIPEVKEEPPVKASPKEEEDRPAATASTNQNQSKGQGGGMLSSLFGFIRPSKSIHLPDDTNKSIVYDKERKQWIDRNNPTDTQTPPPPPPVGSLPSPPMTNNTTTSQNSGAGPARRGLGRPKYCDYLANEYKGRAAASKIEQAVLPPSPFMAHSVGGVPDSSTGDNRNHFQSGPFYQ